MPYARLCCLLLCGLPVFGTAALAETQTKNQTKPAVVQQQRPVVQQQRPVVVQQRPTAIQQLRYANQGAAQRNHVFDGTKKPVDPVRTNTATKPNPVGQRVYSTASTPGYKPAQHLHTNPVPSPTVTRTATTTPTVTRSTTTATVSRSTTTTTTQQKKP